MRNKTLIKELGKILPEAAGRIKENEPMSLHTSFRVGGPADIFFDARTADEIVAVIRFCREMDLNYLILGRGSNVLVADKGIRGVVICISDSFTGIADSGCKEAGQNRKIINVKAGTSLIALSRQVSLQGLTGLEFACGIPGTLGGAIMMNAGAYEGCMEQVISKTTYLDNDLQLSVIEGKDHGFTYRDSIFAHEKHIIIEAELILEKGNPDEIIEKMRQLNGRRRASQPLEMASAGSAFKRPTGNFAGKLISESGLRGTRVGDAQVSEKHAGFIVNLGSATAAEIYELFNLVRERVYGQTGIELVPEVRFVGDWQKRAK